MTIKNLLKSVSVSCLFFVASMFFAINASAAPRLILNPSTTTSVIDTDFQINLNIDAESQSVFGADAVLLFPSRDLTIKSVTKGDFFTDFNYAQATGRLEIHGFFSTAFQTKSGSGTFATITLSSNKAAGTGTISFNCSGNGSDTDMLDGDGDNILACSTLNQSVVTYSSGTTQNTTNTDTTSSNGATNACNGTCGSVYNCNVNLFCYQGFCRNPECPSESSCGCPSATQTPTATPTPKPKSKSTPKPVVQADGKVSSPTPVVVALTKVTPIPDYTAVSEDELNSDAQNSPIDIKTIIIALVVGIPAIVVIVLIIKSLRKKNNPPKITPPSGTDYSGKTYNLPTFPSPPQDNPSMPLPEPPSNPPFNS